MVRFHRAKPRTRLWLQALECRETPATFTVTNALDNGTGSLRDAITQANANPGADSIVFDSGVFSTAQTINLQSALPNITGDLTMTGPGSGLLTVSRDTFAPSFRILGVENNTAILKVSISGMKLTNGDHVTPAGQAFQQNNGGGLYISNEEVTITDLFITNNQSNAQGGGIAVGQNGRLTMVNCVVSGNKALGLVNGDPFGFGFSGVGGGIYFTADGVLDMTGCTISGNEAKYRGGGIYLYGDSAGVATLRNSTISGNKTTSFWSDFFFTNGGGGISVQANPGSPATFKLTIHNSTIVQNSVASGAKGGGIYSSSSKVTNVIESSVIASNTASTGPDISSTNAVTLNTSAVSGKSTGYTYTFTAPDSNIFAMDFKLGALANNGGPTPTHLPATGSPLIDAGSNPSPAATNDQRGLTRTYDDPAVSSTRTVDIGAVEVQPFGLPTAVASANDVTTAGAGSHTITVTYADSDGIDVSKLGTGDIKVSGPGAFSATPTFLGVDVGSNGTPRIATYAFTPPGTTWDSGDAGLYTVTMVANEVRDTNNNFVPAGAIGTFANRIPRVLTVLNTNDSGAGSLRQAVIDANVGPSHDTITFSPSVFTGGQTIEFKSGQMVISDSLTIAGPGSNKLFLDAFFASRHFTISGPGIIDVTIENLNLTNGRTTAEFVSERGGSISVNGEHLTLDGVFMTGNSVQRANGGAINLIGAAQLTFRNGRISGGSAQSFNTGLGTIGGAGGAISATDAGHMITIEDSLFSGNQAHFYGGAIYSYNGQVSIDRSNFISNSTSLNVPSSLGSGYTGGGGAIQVGDVGILGVVSSLKVTNSLFDANLTVGFGGGVSLLGETSASFTNSTFANNTANTASQSGAGGGVFAIATGINPIEFANCTLAYNQAYAGGGLFASPDPQYIVNGLKITSTIIASNTSPDPDSSPDVEGYIDGYDSLIGVIDGGELVGGGVNVQYGSLQVPLPALLGPLDFNGGPTRTIALLPGSPCLDLGSNIFNLSYDQRGTGFNRNSGKAPDIGAFELQVATAPQVTNVTIDNGSEQRSMVRSITVTFNRLVDIPNPASAFTLEHKGPQAPGFVGYNVVFNNTATETVAILTFAPGTYVNATSLIDGNYEFNVVASQVTLGGLELDGNGDGTTGDNHVAGLHRLFGDANGDRTVTASDFNAFRLLYGQSATGLDFDYNNDGIVSATDFNEFRMRYGVTLQP